MHVTHRGLRRRPPRLHDALDEWAAVQPDAEFGTDAEVRLKYWEAAEASRRMGAGLAQHGVDPGDRVAILARNSVAFVLAYYAASRVGAVLTPLNWRLLPVEIAALLDEASPRIVLTDARHRAVIDELRTAVPSIEHHVALDAWTSWDGALASDYCSAGRNPILYQLFTSGTTARPKAAMLSQAAVCANVDQVAGAIGFVPRERSLVVAPLFHAAVVPSVFAAIARGASLRILDGFDPAAVVGALAGDGIAAAVLVPSMIHACLADVPDVATRDYARLRLIYYGASPIAERTLRHAIEVFGCDFVQSYGLTEATQALTFLSPDDHRRALAGDVRLLESAGQPAPGTEIRIVDADGRPVPVGVIGEIAARGPQLMSGYWARPASSRAALRDGWLDTGDSGLIDQDGYLYVRDRLKDVIVTGGENVSPAMVEAVLAEHWAVADVAVIGAPHLRWGEVVTAVVVLCEAVTADALIEHCRGRLAGFARPRAIEFVPELPRTATGKLLRRTLRERFWEGHERRVAGA